MTMVNLPLLLVLGVGGLCLAYLVVAGLVWVTGRSVDREALRRSARWLAAGSVGTFLLSIGVLLLWMTVYGLDRGIGGSIGAAALLGWPLWLVAPPVLGGAFALVAGRPGE